MDDNDDLSDDLSDDLILKNFLYNKNVKIVCDDGEELNPKEYIKKIEDWMDLVSKNSDRLKCSSCQKFMNFDPKYTIHSQIYGARCSCQSLRIIPET
ncbi:hypothetical protein PL8927_630140 [Planktothrix serta PCC 8927]|uniref:Uncharacterized protein n=1 Tax=Planktothrix serta PCC 8927 TaxID=671068 RepID=A0A7Z9BVY5_9CYAN|nr:hypothetical protein [Planktothrix serta]VXD19725.1 hypothetical protein PL8927_630140 [Planktothrix serta PCC 8927]